MITISAGHWKTGGAVDILNEVVEARKVVNRVVEILRDNKVAVNHIEDNVSNNQKQNLNYLVSHHNKTSRELDVSVHFNSSAHTSNPIGTEVLYYDQLKLSKILSEYIASAGGFKNRGAKERKELYFLNATDKPAVLIEVCFVSSEADAKLYKENFEKICQAIAKGLAEYIGVKINGSKEDTKEKEGELTMSQYKELSEKIEQLEEQLKNKGNIQSDSTVSESHKVSWEWAVSQGIVKGDGKSFNPSGVLTRQQMATMLKRYHDKFVKQ